VSTEPTPSEVLLEVVVEAYPGWLTSQLTARLRGAGRDGGQASTEVARVAGDAVRELEGSLGALLATDVDAQRENPLQVIREVTARAGEVLDRLGVPVVPRDEVETRAMPDDAHALGPIAWRDLGEAVHDAGIHWGAWKAATVLARRRAEGKLGS
jgi:hypothetical protein